MRPSPSSWGAFAGTVPTWRSWTWPPPSSARSISGPTCKCSSRNS